MVETTAYNSGLGESLLWPSLLRKSVMPMDSSGGCSRKSNPTGSNDRSASFLTFAYVMNSTPLSQLVTRSIGTSIRLANDSTDSPRRLRAQVIMVDVTSCSRVDDMFVNCIYTVSIKNKMNWRHQKELNDSSVQAWIKLWYPPLFHSGMVLTNHFTPSIPNVKWIRMFYDGYSLWNVFLPSINWINFLISAWQPFPPYIHC